MVLADELDIHLLAKVGYAWMPKGTQMTGMTPGTNEKHYLAGGFDLATGAMLYSVAVRKTNAQVRELLTRLDGCYPPRRGASGLVTSAPCRCRQSRRSSSLSFFVRNQTRDVRDHPRNVRPRQCACQVCGQSWRSHCTGTSTGAPLSLTKMTNIFAGLVVLAFRPTTCTSSGPS
jgi:hypothetical protein